MLTARLVSGQYSVMQIQGTLLVAWRHPSASVSEGVLIRYQSFLNRMENCFEIPFILTSVY